MNVLPSPDVHLSRLADGELGRLGDAYQDLRFRTASFRRMPGGETAVSYGPVGAAKTLFAVRPRVFAPWDNHINKLKLPPSEGPDYTRYLGDIRRFLSELSTDAGTVIEQIPTLLGRPASSPVKLIDEHNWVRITRGLEAEGHTNLRSVQA